MFQVETLKFQIYPTIEQVENLKQTQSAFVNACNLISQYVFDNDFCLERSVLHNALYRKIREQFQLPAQITQSAIVTVIARHKTVQTQLKRKPFKYYDKVEQSYQFIKRDLTWLQKPVLFNSPIVTLVKDRSYSFNKNGKLSLTTLFGRIHMNYSNLSNKYYNYFDPSWKRGEAIVICRNNKWYIHVSVSREIEETNQFKHVVGIDRGLRQLITTFDEKDKTRFFSGKAILQKRRHFKRLRQELQQKGTKSARKKLKAIAQRENRWMTNVNHQLSKALIDQYKEQTLFVLEDLTHVTFDTVNNRRKSSRYEHHSWSFYQLEQMLQYKANRTRSKVITVSAHFTSQRCPKCGHIDKGNRDQSSHSFCCQMCQYRSNDDRIAAMNIQELGKWYLNGIPNPNYTKL